MTEQHVENQSGPVDPTPETPRAQARPPAQRSGKSQQLLWLLVIALAGVLAAFYWQQTRFSLNQSATLQQIQDRHQALQAALDDTRSAMQSELQSQVGLLENSASSLQSAMTEMQRLEQQDARQLLDLQQGFERQLQETRTLVAALQRQLASLQQRDTRWLNAEAAYLMRMANHKVFVEHNVPTAVQLLQTVESLLADQVDPAARTALISVVSDRASLQSINAPDKMALSARVDELLQKLNEISITSVRELNYQQGVREARQQTSDIAREQGWSAALVTLLRSIFVWRQTDFGELGFVPADQEVLIKQQIALLFEQARIAVVQADQMQFELALQEIVAGLEKHFAEDSELARELIADIESLRSQRVVPDFPDMSGSLALIEQLTEASPNPASSAGNQSATETEQ